MLVDLKKKTISSFYQSIFPRAQIWAQGFKKFCSTLRQDGLKSWSQMRTLWKNELKENVTFHKWTILWYIIVRLFFNFCKEFPLP